VSLDTPVSMVQIEWEFEQLLELYKELAPKKVLEIGTKDGGSLYHWLRLAAPDSTVVYVDFVFNTEYEAWARSDTMLVPVQGNSHNKIIIDIANSYGPFDFVFIDGDHSYEGVKADFEAYGDATVVALHDICPFPDNKEIEVPDFWREIEPLYDTDEIIYDLSQGECGIGVIYPKGKYAS